MDRLRTSAPPQVRVGVLGTGIISRQYHLPLLAKNNRVKVVAAANLHEASLHTLAKDFGIPRAYTDFESMAQDSNIDAVINGLPNYLHAPVSIRMLQAGKHVLCEKPMALTVADCQAMIDAADAAKRTLMIAHNWRFDIQNRWLRDVVQSGVLGTIFKVKAHWIWTHDGPKPGSWSTIPEYTGGGALADMGIHAIDNIAFLFNDQVKPVRVFATMGAFVQPIAVEDTVNLTVEYDNGVTAFIESGWYHNFADGPEGSMEVFGSRGYARTFPTELYTAIEGAWGTYRPAMPPRVQQVDYPMYGIQLDHFIDCLQQGKTPLCDGQKGLRTVALMEAAYRSAKVGQAVAL